MIPSPAGGGATGRRRCYVYLLRNAHDGTFYIGWTTDLLRRLAEHRHGRSQFTRRTSTWELVGVEPYASPEAAKTRERALKRNPRMLRFFKKRLLSRAASGGPQQVMG